MMASDGGRCIDTLRSHTGLASRRTKSEKRLDGVRAAFEKFDTIINEISSNTPHVGEKNRSLAVFCAGSLGRMEASDKSDLDLFVILNDLLRYWRAVCLNYEERRHGANRKFREKNVNLKFSRMLTVFGTVLPLVAKPIGTDVDLDTLCEKTPLERLATGLDWLRDSGLTARWSGILDGYEEFLTWKENPDVETFLTENKGLVNRRAEELSAFLYDALTHKTIRPELRRTLIL